MCGMYLGSSTAILMRRMAAEAKKLMESWAKADWFNSRKGIPDKVTLTVFKVSGETNTDDLSPAPDAWSSALAHWLSGSCLLARPMTPAHSRPFPSLLKLFVHTQDNPANHGKLWQVEIERLVAGTSCRASTAIHCQSIKQI